MRFNETIVNSVKAGWNSYNIEGTRSPTASAKRRRRSGADENLLYIKESKEGAAAGSEELFRMYTGRWAGAAAHGGRNGEYNAR